MNVKVWMSRCLLLTDRLQSGIAYRQIYDSSGIGKWQSTRAKPGACASIKKSLCASPVHRTANTPSNNKILLIQWALNNL